MTPPAPLPEHDFLSFLREHGCEGRKLKKEYAAYRKSDGRFVSNFAVKHGTKREVLDIYRVNFLKALDSIRAEEFEEQQNEEQQEKSENDAWKEQDWYKEQQELEKQLNEEPT